MVFHWNLRDKFPQVSRTLLSILPDLNNAGICLVSVLKLISNSASLFGKHFGTVQSSSPGIIDIAIVNIFRCLFSSHKTPKYLLIFSLYSVVCRKSKIHLMNFFFLVNLFYRPGLVFWLELGVLVWISKSQRILTISFSRTVFERSHFQFVRWSTWYFCIVILRFPLFFLFLFKSFFSEVLIIIFKSQP